MRQRMLRALPVAAGLTMFFVALEVLRVELRAVSWSEITADVLKTPATHLAAAIGLTALNYLVLTGYDLLAFKYIRRTLPRRRIVGASLLTYAISNSVGFAMFSGASVRYRFYTRWGVTADELSRIVFSCAVTFWLGLLALGGLSFVLSPLPGTRDLPGHEAITVAGWGLIFAVGAFMAATVVRRKPIRLPGLTLPLPGPALAGQQLLVSAIDWALAGSVLYVLLPQSDLPFLTFLGSFLVAILLGMV